EAAGWASVLIGCAIRGRKRQKAGTSPRGFARDAPALSRCGPLCVGGVRRAPCHGGSEPPSSRSRFSLLYTTKSLSQDQYLCTEQWGVVLRIVHNRHTNRNHPRIPAHSHTF